jgi:hypothetical protein
MATDYAKDLFDEYGRPIVVLANSSGTTADVTKDLFDECGRPIKVAGT